MPSPPLLDGVKVLDLSVWRPGPHATMLLCQLGAQVLKVEPPGGDPMRIFSELFVGLNAGKRSVVLDLRSPEGRQRLLELAADADVAIEGWRPGVAARLGASDADLRAVNPGLVYCSISGYGQTGPLVDVPGHDICYQAWAGVLSPRGEPPPQVSNMPTADVMAGMFGALTICAALARRATTGEGEYIDVSMTSVQASLTGVADPGKLEGREETGLRFASYGTYETRDDKWVAFGGITEQGFWDGLCSFLGVDDGVGLPVADRVARDDEFRPRFAAAVRRYDRDEIVAQAGEYNLPIAPVLTRAEMAAAAQFREIGLTDGTLVMGFPSRLTEHPTVWSHDVPAAGADEGWA